MLINEKLARLVVPAFILLMLLVAPCFSLPRAAGVRQGDFFRYSDISLEWNFNQDVPSFLADVKNISWSSISITSAYQETVAYESTVQYKNGSVTVENISGSVNSNNPSWIVAANLKQDDILYNDSSRIAWINDTSPWMYPEGTRNINHVQITSLGTADDIEYIITNDWYYDQISGMTVKYSLEFVNNTGSFAGTGLYQTNLVESNAWVVPEYSRYLLIPLFILLTLVMTTISMRQKTRKSLKRGYHPQTGK